MCKSLIAPEGWAYIITTGLISAAAYFINPLLFAASFVLFCFVIFFFRDPEREIPQEPGIIVSAADGTVVSIEQVYEPEFLQGVGIKVSVFLSIFNVHVNRAPIHGSITHTRYVPGKFLPASRACAPEFNERNIIGIEGGGVRVLVTQVAGILARRIVFRKKVGDVLELGERFGMIKFGSCTQVVVPAGTRICVKVGDKVKGGVSIIGRLNDEKTGQS